MSSQNMSDSGRAPIQEKARRLTFWEVVGSTFAAAFGVQTRANRVRDFTHGRFIHYIISGIIFVAMFVAVMILIVRWVLSNGAL